MTSADLDAGDRVLFDPPGFLRDPTWGEVLAVSEAGDGPLVCVEDPDGRNYSLPASSVEKRDTDGFRPFDQFDLEPAAEEIGTVGGDQ